jgi:hypothetical protein
VNLVRPDVKTERKTARWIPRHQSTAALDPRLGTGGGWKLRQYAFFLDGHRFQLEERDYQGSRTHQQPETPLRGDLLHKIRHTLNGGIQMSIVSRPAHVAV